MREDEDDDDAILPPRFKVLINPKTPLLFFPLPHNEAENIKEEEEKEGTLLPPVCSCVVAGAKGRVDPNYYFGFAAYVDRRGSPHSESGFGSFHSVLIRRRRGRGGILYPLCFSTVTCVVLSYFSCGGIMSFPLFDPTTNPGGRPLPIQEYFYFFFVLSLLLFPSRNWNREGKKKKEEEEEA